MLTRYPDNKIEALIGFDFIRQFLWDKCASQGGKAKVEKLNPTANYKLLSQKLAELSAFCEVDKLKQVQIIGWEPLSLNLKKCEIEGYLLSLAEIVGLKDFLYQAVQVQKTLTQHITVQSPLVKYTGESHTLQALYLFMDDIIGANGQIKHTASGVLKKLVVDKAKAEKEVLAVLERLHKHFKKENITAETTPTVKNGRYVLPIITSQRNRVEGVVMGESGSKNTSYIEPLEVVRSNNQLTSISIEIDQEVDRLLGLISFRIGAIYKEIYYAEEKLCHLDFLASIVKYKQKFGAEIIDVSKSSIVLSHAKHPKLMQHCQDVGQAIVPINFRFNETERIMIISGPNAGGKSVALKTMAALQYAFQCGLPVPAGAKSETILFDHFLVDIGDNQSMDSDLSTYSSHLSAMNEMLLPKKGKVFIAIDEIGAGTDPKLGGPMAEAMIMHYAQQQYFGIITTHFSNLKTMKEEGIFNASMLFDTENLVPLFQLNIGNPGSSFVLELAKRLKVPKHIINKAKTLAGNDVQQLDVILAEVDASKSQLLQAQDRLRKKEYQLDNMIQDYQSLKLEIVKNKKSILETAKLEASAILKSANKQIEHTVKTIKESKAKPEVVKKQKEQISAFQNKITETTNQTALRTNEPIVVSTVWKIGDWASIDNQTQAVEIIGLKKNKAEVVMNNIRTLVNKDRLFPAKKEKNNATGNLFSQFVIQRMGAFKTKIDLRGEREADARIMLQQYLDDAYSLGIKEVSVVHGRGDGALKKAVKEILKATKYIEAWNYDHADRGGDGATFVNLK